MITDLFKVTEIDIVYRRKQKVADRPKIHCSQDVYNLLKANWNADKLNLLEQFKILLLDTGNSVLGISEISSGGIAGTVADPRLIFSTALKAKASSLILAHNHPSGNLKPSHQDINITKRMVEAGQLLEIKVLDHIILAEDGYISLADEGYIVDRKMQVNLDPPF